MVRPPSNYFYGTEAKGLDGKTPILICECLWGGCWDFVCEIEITNKKVSWENFEQVHRKNWNYDELGVFIFDKEKYENALRELETK